MSWRPDLHRGVWTAVLVLVIACGEDPGSPRGADGPGASATGSGAGTPAGDGGGGGGGGSTTAGSTAGQGGDGAGAGDGGATGGAGGDGGAPGVGGGGGGPIEVRILQLNLCHSGVNEGCFTGDDVIEKAVGVIGDVAPDLVTLNEVCRGDLPTLAGATGATDHRFTPALRADGTPVRCVSGEDYGIGLLSFRAPVWAAPVTGVYSQQSSTTERRVWICMGYDAFVGCTTHLSTSGPTALAQCHDFAGGPVATAAASGPVATAGDWNLRYGGTPDAQDCVPPGFFRKGDGALQHALLSSHFEFVETVVIDMDGTTDHPGLEVRLTLGG